MEYFKRKTRNKGLGLKHSSKRQNLTYVAISISIGLSCKCFGMVPQVNISPPTKREVDQ